MSESHFIRTSDASSIKAHYENKKELNVPTIFNLIGPLTNPVNLETQFVGIYKRDMLLPVAQVLQKLGRKQALVVNGSGF